MAGTWAADALALAYDERERMAAPPTHACRRCGAVDWTPYRHRNGRWYWRCRPCYKRLQAMRNRQRRNEY